MIADELREENEKLKTLLRKNKIEANDMDSFTVEESVNKRHSLYGIYRFRKTILMHQ